MKSLCSIFLSLSFAVLLSSCNLFQLQFNPESDKAIVIAKEQKLFNIAEGNKIGETSILVNYKVGDTLDFKGEWNQPGSKVASYVRIEHEGKYYAVGALHITKIKDWQMRTITPSALLAPKERGEEMWGRAVAFVSTHSDMKIQSQTDYLLQTFNPIKKGQIGFMITKRFEGEHVIFSITQLGDPIVYQDAYDRDDKKCAYFMMYGTYYN